MRRKWRPNLDKRGDKMEIKMMQNGDKMETKWRRSGDKMETKCRQKWSRNGDKMETKLRQKWHKHETNLRPKWRHGRFPLLRPVIPNHPDWFSRWSQTRIKNRNFKVKKLGSDLVVQTSRLVPTVQLFELFHMGMVSGVLVFKGFAKVWIFRFWYTGSSG